MYKTFRECVEKENLTVSEIQQVWSDTGKDRMGFRPRWHATVNQMIIDCDRWAKQMEDEDKALMSL